MLSDKQGFNKAQKTFAPARNRRSSLINTAIAFDIQVLDLMSISYQRHRISGIDIIRIVCALLIYMGHSIGSYGCTYGSQLADAIIFSARSPIMSMFFMLSGFSISYNYLNGNEWDYHATRQFYAKRLIQIVPAYLLIHILWLFLGKDSFIRWLFLTPLELTALQSMYPNIMGLLHNGGTWFISCLLISYLIYPILRCIFHDSKPGTVFSCTICITAALIYLPFIDHYYSLGGAVYTNPVLRALEFTLGVLANYCAFYISRSRDHVRHSFRIGTSGFVISVLLCVVLIYLRIDPVVLGSRKLAFTLDSLLLYPILMIILYISYISRSSFLENNRVLKYMSGLIYYFFILQLVLWRITDFAFAVIRCITGTDLKTNSIKIVLSFSICLILSIAISELINKPFSKWCFRKLSVFRQN